MLLVPARAEDAEGDFGRVKLGQTEERLRGRIGHQALMDIFAFVGALGLGKCLRSDDKDKP